MRSQQGVGYILAVVQAVMYSTMGIISKYLYGTGMTPQQVMVLRFGGTVLVLGLFLLVWRRRRLFSRKPLVYVQGLFFVASALLYFLSVQELTAGLATVIFYAFPAVVALLTALVFRERPGLRVIGSLALALVGIVLISGLLGSGEVRLSPAGIAYGIGGCVAFAVYTVLGQKAVEKDSPFTMTFSIAVVGLAVCALCLPGEFPAMLQLSTLQVGLGLAIVLFNTIIPVVLLLAAIKRIGATKASLISILETPFSLLIAFLVLGETLTPLQGAGSVLVVASILIVTLPGKKEQAPPPA